MRKRNVRFALLLGLACLIVPSAQGQYTILAQTGSVIGDRVLTRFTTPTPLALNNHGR